MIHSRPDAALLRSSSSRGWYPSRITPPFRARAGGSSAMAFRIRGAIHPSSTRSPHEPASSTGREGSSRVSRRAESWPSVRAKAMRSRGPALVQAILPAILLISASSPSISRTLALTAVFLEKYSTVSSRRLIAAGDTSGTASMLRMSRPPMGVMLRSRRESRVGSPDLPRMLSRISRFLSVIPSIRHASPACR